MHRSAPLLAIVVLAACASSTAVSRRVTTTTTSTTTTSTTSTSTTSTTSPPAFVGTAAPIDAATARRMTGVSWHPGCPVSLDGLRLLHISFRGFDGAVHAGELVVARAWAERVVGVLRTLFDAGFPIERMQLVDDFGASDDGSVLANNTSAFNCRPVSGGTGWSRHAYGTAIDLDPRQNPYVYPDGHLLDPAAEPYRDRSSPAPGVIHEGDAVYRAFAAIGWRWGGHFTDTPDPQHFDVAP